MGLVVGAAVAPLHVSTAPGQLDCAENITTYTTVTIGDIQAKHGVRSPGPASAQRSFTVCFAAESHLRLLNATELTFYEILAEYYTRPLAAGDPDPYVGGNWVPVTRYFGSDVTWRPYPVSVPPTGPGPPMETAFTCSPNPFRERLRIAWGPGYTSERSEAQIQIYGVSGRRVRSIRISPGTFSVMWDGCDDGGRLAPAGIYWIRGLQWPHERASKVVLLP